MLASHSDTDEAIVLDQLAAGAVKAMPFGRDTTLQQAIPRGIAIAMPSLGQWFGKGPPCCSRGCYLSASGPIPTFQDAGTQTELGA